MDLNEADQNSEYHESLVQALMRFADLSREEAMDYIRDNTETMKAYSAS